MKPGFFFFAPRRSSAAVVVYRDYHGDRPCLPPAAVLLLVRKIYGGAAV
jgi:hypothetical protein